MKSFGTILMVALACLASAAPAEAGVAYYTSTYPPPVYYGYGRPYLPGYVVVPAPTPRPPTYLNTTGAYCREFSQHVRIGNRVQESFGTACLQPDGSWRVVP